MVQNHMPVLSVALPVPVPPLWLTESSSEFVPVNVTPPVQLLQVPVLLLDPMAKLEVKSFTDTPLPEFRITVPIFVDPCVRLPV